MGNIFKYIQHQFLGFFFEIVERRDQYQGYGSRNASARLAAQSNYKQADRTAYV